MQGLIAPVAKEMEAAQAKTLGRRTAEDMHYKMVAEAMGALSWVCNQPGTGMSIPPQHIDEAVQGADFYANKVSMLCCVVGRTSNQKRQDVASFRLKEASKTIGCFWFRWYLLSVVVGEIQRELGKSGWIRFRCLVVSR